MADTRNRGRIKKYGVCLNDKCDKYKQIQEIEHGELECPECKKKLSPCAPPKKNNKKLPIYIGIGGAVVLGLVLLTCLLVPSIRKNDSLQTDKDTLLTDSLNTDTIKKPIEVETLEVDTIDTVEDDTIEQQPEPVVEEPKTVSKPTPEVKRKPNGTINKNLSFADFDGTTMTFKQRHVIPGTSKIAQPGDVVKGEWRDGEVNFVRWYHKDGSPSETLTHE